MKCNVAQRTIREEEQSSQTCVSVAGEAFVGGNSHPAGCSVEELHDRVGVKGWWGPAGDGPAAGGQPGPRAGGAAHPDIVTGQTGIKGENAYL